MAELLARKDEHGNRIDDFYEADQLRHLRAGCVLEEYARMTGFVLGVEYLARLLLLGAAPKGGAR